MWTSFLLSTGSFDTRVKKASYCQVQFCSYFCWEFYLAHNVSESQEHQLCTVWSKIKLNWGNLQLQSYHQPNLRITQIFPTASLHSTIYAWHFLVTTGHFFYKYKNMWRFLGKCGDYHKTFLKNPIFKMWSMTFLRVLVICLGIQHILSMTQANWEWVPGIWKHSPELLKCVWCQGGWMNFQWDL